MKRRIILILLFLAAGAIVNVAVAWGISAWAEPAPGAAWSLPAPDLWPRSVPASWPRRPTLGGTSENFGVRVWVTSSGEADVMTYGQSVFGYGWPLLALETEFRNTADYSTNRMSPTRAFQTLAGVSIPSSWQRAGRTYARVNPFLPLRPIWPGFAINTVFYAAILWGVWLVIGPFALRRRRRIKRGLCPKCAYDLRNRASDSSVCPECGAAVRPASNAA